MTPISWDVFLQIRKLIPLVDVRSPLEFNQGHIRNAINIPLLNNEERVAVGTDYKNKGQQAAIMTGFRLVGPRLHDIIEETKKIATGQEIIVHCWRGGMRSSNFGYFAEMAGIKAHSIQGGYKTFRTNALNSFKSSFKFILVTGCTGSGKSEILRVLKEQGEQVIDLESLANHKGSAFGALLMPEQPTTEQFQNNLYEEILSLDSSRTIWIEDESIAIGKIFLPHDLWNTMAQSPMIKVDVHKNVRIERLVTEYGAADRGEFLAAMVKVTKKLGGQHFKAAKEKLENNDMHGTIDILLTYYDKAYEASIAKRKDRELLSLPWNGNDISLFVKHITKEVKGKLKSTL